jgi:kynurenine formamidase
MCAPGTVETVCTHAKQRGLRVNRRAVLFGGAGAALTAAFPGVAHADRPRRKGRCLKDLTHTFAESLPVFVDGTGPVREPLADYETDGFYAQRWTFGEHSGTHLDAPGHFIPGGRLSPDITPEELIVPLVVVDIARRAADDPDATVEVRDLVRFERRHGRIPRGALVAMDSGWADKVDDPLAYKGGEAFPNYHFPGFGEEAADWLVAKRNVTALGVDTLSIDPGNSTTFPVHLDFLGRDRYGLENLNNLDKIPPRGATAYVGLLPCEEGSGGPCRVIASW